jgi:hypothetical protein
MRGFVCLPLAILVIATPAVVAAAAPSKQACVTAYEETQLSMRRSRLLHAREALQTCLNEACPAVLRSDCAGWLTEVEARTPSVVIECTSGGTPVREARLFVDGELREGGIDGKAMELDPGSHTFRVEMSSSPPVSVDAIVHEGEKLKAIHVEIPSASSATEATKEPSVPEGPREQRPIPWTVYAAGGLGAAAAIGFVGFAISGSSMKSDLESCKPDCSAAQISDVRTQFIVADVMLAITALAAGAATYLFVTRPAIAADGPRTTMVPASSRPALSIGPGSWRFAF